MLVPLAVQLTTSSDAAESSPRQHWIELTFKDGPVHLHSISFINYYTYSLSIMHSLTRAESDPMLPAHARGRPAQWRRVLRKHQLMASPHFEDDAQAEHVLSHDFFEADFDTSRVVRLRFVCVQPSPSWARYSLRDIRCFALRTASPVSRTPALSAADAEFSKLVAEQIEAMAAIARQVRHTIAEQGEEPSCTSLATGTAAGAGSTPGMAYPARAVVTLLPYPLGEWNAEAHEAYLL
ncbi:hypothetical protein AB1Y20_007080 [Prymnesium parvum]|uniref:Uncharacterized protein n=1 Tax=Prymnesium parvum TaxID=97485 RepID=A0AB34J268_PRYPA